MNIEKTYIYGNSQILAQHEGDYGATRYFYLHDRLGSVRQVIDTMGKVVNHYTYRPFGELYPGPDFEETVTNPFKFTGQFYDFEINEYYLRARMYDPYISRFTARDPVPVLAQFEQPLALHVYLYCGNDPVNRIDQTGLWWEIVHRSFGQFGFGAVTPSRPYSLFDYGQLDVDYPPYNPSYTRRHFRSREDVYPNILMAAASGNATTFGYMMHEWQDSYVHYDRGFRWWRGGHIRWDLTHELSADDPDDPINILNRAYERCDYTTRELGHVPIVVGGLMTTPYVHSLGHL